MDRIDFLISKLEDNNTSWWDWDLYDAELFQRAEEGNQKAIEYYIKCFSKTERED